MLGVIACDIWFCWACVLCGFWGLGILVCSGVMGFVYLVFLVVYFCEFVVLDWFCASDCVWCFACLFAGCGFALFGFGALPGNCFWLFVLRVFACGISV